ncbi:MAG: HAMP domain-containing sensor histidine kinase [Bacteroidia bacterium]|nr:HAMP domain-containing sensor histidine kinase [Bacteroidia bacterium]
MMKLKLKLSLFNLLSKLFFTALFLLLIPPVIERINLRQIDNDLIEKREKVIALISETGIEPFISSESSDAFGSYNILKEEFISLEKIETGENFNFIEETSRLIENEEITYRVLNYSFRIDSQMYLLEVGKSLTSILDAKKNITSVILVFLVFIIIITLLTDIQYTHFLLRPLDKITSKLKGISNPSLFEKTPVKTTTSDFYNLDKALRELMENIDELFRKEKEITVNISHELLTPISVLRSKLENLLLKQNLEPDVSVKIEESLKTLHRLQSLVNSLLLIARIESHQFICDETISLNEVLQENIMELKPIAEDKNVILNEELTEELHFSGANRSLIYSMFYNVINNAVKNTPAGGEVTVNSLLRQGRFIVNITDNGKGMTEAQKNTLFERFRTKSEAEREGTGIGLAITKTIADFHKIEISVISEPEKGTVFSFIFP